MESTQSALEHLQHRIRSLERRLRISQAVLGLGCTALVAYACTVNPRAEAQPRAAAVPQVLTVRGLVVVDEQGRQRIAIGAPWPSLQGRRSEAQGVGMLIVDSAGVDRLNVASPAPDPPGTGKRIAPANGLTFYDQRGNERGGVGYLDNGRSVLVLDNDGGEGAGVFSFNNGYVGIGIMREGQFRALMDYNPETRATSLALSDSAGRARVRLGVSASGEPTSELIEPRPGANPRP